MHGNYEKPEKYKIINIESLDPGLATINFSVDTIEDLYRLQNFSDLE